MKSVIGVAVAAFMLLSGQAFANDHGLKIEKTKTLATGQGYAGSSSGVVGGSAVLGATQIVTSNGSVALGNVTSKSQPGKSSIDQTYVSNSTSTLASQSLGLAGSIGGSNGTANVAGFGTAKTKMTKVGH